MNRKKRTLGTEQQRKNVDPETNRVYVQKLSDMVSCRTVFTPEGTWQPEFERFYQVDDYFTGQIDGWGLGLCMVQKIVELHNGSINVISDRGLGSIFTVSLPVL